MKLGRPIAALFAIALIAVALTGCGPGPYTVSCLSVHELTGHTDHVYDNSTYSWSAALGTGSELTAGSFYSAEGSLYHNFRLLFSFNLIGLAGAHVQSAVLKIYLVNVSGTPFTTLGNVLIDPVLFDELTTARHKHEDIDFTVAAVTGQISDGTPGAWKTVDVTETLQDLIDLERDYAQFRLGHQAEVFTGSGLNESNWGGAIDQINKPTLEITYSYS